MQVRSSNNFLDRQLPTKWEFGRGQITEFSGDGHSLPSLEPPSTTAPTTDYFSALDTSFSNVKLTAKNQQSADDRLTFS